MSKTNYLQAVISDLQRTAGPYRCAKTGREADATNDPRGHSIASSAAAPQNIASRLAKHRRSEHS